MEPGQNEYENEQNFEKEKAFRIFAESFIVGNINTGEILIERNKDRKFPIASITKLMTAVAVSELFSKNDLIEITSRALNTSGNSAGFKKGEKIKAIDLIYPLLMVSSNDAAEAFAGEFGRSNFIKKMNEKAVSIGLWTTSFNDPTGLSQKNTSNSSDMFNLAKWILEFRPDIFKITRERVKNISEHTWTNTTNFLNWSSYMGGKNGFTEEAGRTALYLFDLKNTSRDEAIFAVVILQSKNRDGDVVKLLDLLKENYGWSY